MLLWVNNVVPSLLPFLICLELLKQTNVIQILGTILEPITQSLFKIPGCGAFAIALGVCSGYPVGAKITSSLRSENQCSKVEGERLLAFTNTSGPLFIIGSVGVSMFSDSKIGVLLLITHFVSAIIVGIIFRFYPFNIRSILRKKHCSYANNKAIDASAYSSCTNNKIVNTSTYSSINNGKNKKRIRLSELGSIMGSGIKNSISTLLLICGFLVFFSVLGTVLDKIGCTNFVSTLLKNLFISLGFSNDIATEISIGIFNGFLEMTSAIKALSTIAIDPTNILPYVAILLGFGGLSVHMQVASIICHTDLSIYPYLLGKTLHGIIAGIITYFVANNTDFFEAHTVETFSSMVTNQFIRSSSSINLLLMTLGGIAIFCLSLMLFSKKKL